MTKYTSLEVLSTHALVMQSDPWGGIEPEHKADQSTIEGNVSQENNNFDGQIIMLQPPSNASKIIGIFCIIAGAFNVLSLVAFLLLPQIDPITGEELSISTSSLIITILSGLISIFTLCVGGYMMINYQRRGIFIVIGGILIGFIISIVSVMSGDYDGWGDSLEMDNNVANGILIGIQALCNAICAVIVAIPLMIANNGLDDSKLF